jgi:hypothetical protein
VTCELRLSASQRGGPAIQRALLCHHRHSHPGAFLAIAVQGPALKELLDSAEGAASQSVRRRIGYVRGEITKNQYRRLALTGIGSVVVRLFLALLVFVYGILEETSVLIDLHKQQAGNEADAILAVTTLALVAATPPLTSTFTSLIRAFSQYATQVTAIYEPGQPPEVEITDFPESGDRNADETDAD